MAADKQSLRRGFTLSGWRVEPLQGFIRSPDGDQIHVTPKAMDVLVCLAVRPGRITERSTIFDEVWGSLHRSDEALTHCVGELRRAFNDKPEHPQFFQTVPKRGYRLVATPDGLDAPKTPNAQVDDRPPGGFIAVQLHNLRKRKVFQSVIGYPVLAWLLLQIVDVLWEYLLYPLGAPGWIVPSFVVLLAVGYPIAIFMVWAVDLTPEGVKVTTDSEGSTPIAGLAILGIGSVSATILALVLFFNSYEAEQPPDRPVTPLEIAVSPLKNSIAVLRFLNIHNDPKIQYLGDGLTEELIHELTNLKTLKVAARTSVWPLIDKDMQAPEIAERLNVDKVLEGSVRADGENVRVTAQLIDRNGFHIWSEVYNSEKQNILEIQKDIAARVVDELGVILADDLQKRLDSNPTSDSAAYDNYLRGRQYLRQPSTNETLAEAEKRFATAIALDNRFSLAYAGACEAHLGNYRLTRDTNYFEKAEVACHRALTLDGGLAEVYTALGNLYRHFGQNEKAEQEYQTALDINPMMEEATFGLGRTYQAQSRLREAEDVLLRTVILEPGYWGSHFGVGNFLHRQGRFAEAVPYYEKVTELAPDYVGGYVNLGSTQHWLGNWDAAEAAVKKSIELRPNSMAYQNLGSLYYYRRQYSDAAESARKAIEFSPNDHRAWGRLAAALWQIDSERDAAIAAYRKAIELAKAQLTVNPDEPEDLYYLGGYLVHVDQADAAREAIARSVKLSPENPSTHYFSALVEIRLGNEEKSVDQLEKAVSFGYSLKLLENDPQFTGIKDNSRFRALLASGSTGNSS